MKAVVHIGTEKTGTTSIQQFLFANQKKLLKYGYHFLQSAGPTNNWALPAYCSVDNRFDDFYRNQSIKTEEQLEQFKREFVGKFEAEINGLDRNVHTVVISSEHFHSRLRTEKDVEIVRGFLSKYFDEIKIICYLREQAETCTSWYSTSMKSGGTDSFYDFVRRCAPDSYYFNYFQLLNNWEKHFGADALDVAIFDPKGFRNGSLLDDFAARIDPALPGKLNNAVHAINQSLSPAGQALARAINQALPLDDGNPEAGELRDRLKSIVLYKLSGRGQQMTLAMRQSIFDSFVDSNEKVRKKYFPKKEQLFSYPEKEESTDRVVDDDLFEVLREIFRELSSGTYGNATADYERIWAAISSSVGDAVSVRQERAQPGVQVSLTPEEGAILRRAAKRIEGRDLEAATLLMELAYQADPRLPGIQARLELYRKKATEAPKLDFMFTYHGGEAPSNEEEARKAGAMFDRWWAALDVPGGSPVRPLMNMRTVLTGEGADQSTDLLFTAFTLCRAESMEEAISIAATCPHLVYGGEIQVMQLEPLQTLQNQ